MSSPAMVLALAGIYSLTLTLSLYRLDLPILDGSPVRQVQTADITRHLFRNDHNLFKPQRYYGAELKAFILEFPLYNAAVAGGYAVAGRVDERIGRLVSITAWLAAGLCLFALVRPYCGDRVALATLFFFHLSPLGIEISRSFQPEALMMALAIATILAWDRWLRSGRRSAAIAATICGTLALLVKMPIAHIGLPIAYLMWLANTRQRRTMALSALVTVVIALVWGAHGRALTIAETPQIAGNWTLDNWFSLELSTSPGFYRRLLAIWRDEVFGAAMMGLAAVGLLMRPAGARHAVFHVWFAATLIYLCAFSQHAITHDYYNVPVIAVGALFAARALDGLSELSHQLLVNPRLLQAATVVFVAWATVSHLRSDAYAIRRDMVGVSPAAEAIRRHTKSDALLVAPGYILHYFADRPGWELSDTGATAIARLEERQASGAEFYANENRPALERDQVFATYLRQYPVVIENHQFVVFDIGQRE